MTNINNGDCRFLNCSSISVVKLFLFYFTLGCPVTLQYFSVAYSNQVHALKAQNRCSQLFLFTQNQQIFHSTIISHRRTLSDHVGTKILYYFQQQRLSRVMLGKDDFFFMNTTVHFPTFEDRGRLHVAHNKINHCRDNPSQACLSRTAADRDQT